MKGILFNLLETCVTQEHGADLWDDVLDAAGLNGAYTSMGNYPDDHLSKLLSEAALRLDDSVENIQRWFGRKAIGPMAALYPSFFDPHKTTRTFVFSLNEIIHPQVRDLYPGADVPTFRFDTSKSDMLVLHYESPRKMCKFAEGLVEGAAEHFGEHVSIHQPLCMNRNHGDRSCAIHCQFSSVRNE